MKILALDLGTTTGYALEANNYPLSCGSFELASETELKAQRKLRMDRRGDIRFTRLLIWLRQTCRTFTPDWIVFEDVEFAKTRMQAHLWATWRAAVWLMALEYSVEIECCPTGTLKKFATGNGAANKDLMARWLTRNPRFAFRHKEIVDAVTGAKLDDNAVDALHLLHWAQHLFKS